MHRGTSRVLPCIAVFRRVYRIARQGLGNASPSSGSSPALNVRGGAQRGGLLARGIFTGEARRKPPCDPEPEILSQISGLRNHDLAVVDSRREAREATFGEARWPEATPESQFLRSR